MQIAIMALGSRGDVQPYIALGQGLTKAGHTVRLVTHENYATLAAAHGLDYRPMRGDVQAFAESDEMLALLEKGNFFAINARTAQAAHGAALEWAEDGLAACRGVDLIIVGLGGLHNALALGEKLGLPVMQTFLVPFDSTRSFPSVLLPASLRRFGGTFNFLSHGLTRQMMWQGFRAADKAARQEVLGLPPAPFWGAHGSSALPTLYGFSPSVIPKPADWGTNLHVTGYWFLDAGEDWSPPPALLDFLDAGPAPIYVGFGSMGSRKPKETTELVLGALRRTGQRAVLLSGWGGLHQADLPPSVYMADSLPHAWLFPRMAAVVHHGGAGTTAAGLRAGVPSIITPFFADQPFWGQRVVDLGVGPQPIPRKVMTVERLAAALEQAVSDTSMRERAAALGAKIRAEDGIGAAVQVISQAL
ncbi:MAG: glycosyltransferase family 1 protein [Anaerolineae bacterium]|nr:glycosyltransferase family 1 protein [Anaerolineae bacterium]